jgi:outer membrane protein assembly factor BamB
MFGGNFTPPLDFSGWDDDVVIPYGRMLVVMSSDSDRLLALDRRTGDRVWESPRTSPFGTVASYCLGVNGRGLFVAGKNVVRRYDLPSGRLVQEKEIENSFGRGCVTETAVYLPVNDSILKLDLELKHDLAQVGVALTSDEPVGNLFSDGEKLWVVGAGRVYALTALEHRLEMLAEQIAAGDAEAQLNRMRLYFKHDRHELALADLRGAYILLQSQASADDAAERLFAAMNELKLPQSQPLVALALVTEQFGSAPSPRELGREAAARLDGVLASALSAIHHTRPPGAVAAILLRAPLLNGDQLLTAASFAIDSAATRDDIPRLVAAIEQGPPAAQIVSIRAAARLGSDDVKPPLKKLLAGGDDRVRLAAARALANLGERKNVLEAFVDLLASEDLTVRYRTQQSLQTLTSHRVPFAAEGSAADRAATAKAWQQWIEANGSTAKLKLPLSDRPIVLGRTLVVAAGALVELDADRKERWQTRLPGAALGCQGLPSGHRLVAIHSHSTVVEFDDAGKEVWKKDRLPAPPTSVQRLESGNTLVTCGNAQQIIEIAPDGSMGTTITVPGHPVFAQRLDSGNTLICLQQTQRVVEVNSSGKIVWEVRTDGTRPSHAIRLDNGNTLVTLTQGRKIVEYDPTGKTIVWSSQVPLINPSSAQRLANGNTLVADQAGIHEVDATGKNLLWQRRMQQVTGLSSF